MTKSELRKLYLQKRLAIKEEDYITYNAQICNQFFSTIDLSLIKVIHTYLPIEKKREPDTWMIIDRIKQQFPNIRISIPRVKNNVLENFYFEEKNQLEKNNWGIPEPKHGIPTPADKIDLVIVPLLAFDKSGARVGYGKGFYDKFLKGCRPDCKKIGLSFFEPIEQISDTNEFDINITHCITPTKLYQF